MPKYLNLKLITCLDIKGNYGNTFEKKSVVHQQEEIEAIRNPTVFLLQVRNILGNPAYTAMHGPHSLVRLGN